MVIASGGATSEGIATVTAQATATGSGVQVLSGFAFGNMQFLGIQHGVA